MMRNFGIFTSAIMAGICISIGCIAFLTVGGLYGAILFSFGLLSVVHYRLKLYTGTVGFMRLFPVCHKDIIQHSDNTRIYPSYKDTWTTLLLVILGNIAGCILTAFAASWSSFAISSEAIVLSRLSLPWWSVIVRAAFCGFIMTTAVKFGREEKWLPLLFGVPLFIMCGFLHSIADSFYYAFSGILTLKAATWLGLTYVGNYIGCSLYKLFTKNDAA